MTPQGSPGNQVGLGTSLTVVRGRFAAFVAALVVFLVGLKLQITAYGVILAFEDEELGSSLGKVPGRPDFVDLQLWLLEVTGWVLLALTIFVLFRRAFAAVLAVGLAVPYAVFGAVNEINALRQPQSSNGLHGWDLFCQQVGGPLIVLGAIATGVTFALAHRVFLAPVTPGSA